MLLAGRIALTASLVASVLGASVNVKRATPSLYLVGDSTTASHAASEGIQGWGTQIAQYLTGITVVNKAVSGRSARSYWREGKWTAVQALLKSGDYVVIEMGHNDGGSPDTSDRADVFGDTDTPTQTVTLADGTVEVVHTFPWYLKQMIAGAKSKGAIPIVSSQTPNNPFETTDTINYTPGRFVNYAQYVAGNTSVAYVDHYYSTLSYYDKLGKATVTGYFPNDHTHTNTAGADSVAWAFLSGLRCASAKSVLAPYLNSVGAGAGARCH